MAHINIPVFVPHYGCPHNCVFCDQKKITGQKSPVTKDMARKIIDDHLLTANHNKDYIEIAFFGGSFTAIDRETQDELCSLAKEYIDKGVVHTFRCSTRPDCIDKETLLRLKSFGIGTIELGVQSTDDTVLKMSERGHTKEDVIKASLLIKEHKIKLGLQMMTNLPGDTFEKSISTCEDIISLKPDCVRIYPTLTIKGTKLYDMYQNGEYIPFSLEDTTELLSILLTKFKAAGIEVIRVGLQTTDNINKKTVIGPYHESIRELAESRIFRKDAEKIFSTIENDNITVSVHPADVSKFIGQKRCNITYFKEKLSKNITVIQKISIPKGSFKVI